EDSYVLMTEVAERPPGAGRRGRARVDVHHDRARVGDAEPAHRPFERVGGGQRVASAFAGRAGQGALQIAEDGAGQVALAVELQAGRAAEPPAHVEQGDV